VSYIDPVRWLLTPSLVYEESYTRGSSSPHRSNTPSPRLQPFIPSPNTSPAGKEHSDPRDNINIIATASTSRNPCSPYNTRSILPGLSIKPSDAAPPFTKSQDEPSKRVKRKSRPISEIDPPVLTEDPPSKRVKRAPVRKPRVKKPKKEDNETKRAAIEDDEKYWKHIDAAGYDWEAIVPKLP